MSKQVRQALEIAAVAAVLALAVLLALPAARQEPAGSAAAAQAPAPAAAVAPGGARPEAAPPEQIAVLFGWRPARPAAAPRAPAAAPLAADWMAYLGFVTDSGGAERFFYKDRKTGRVVTVSAGESGWRLVEARASELIAEHEGQLYALKRGK